MLICCPPSTITFLRQTLAICGLFCSLSIRQRALLCILWAGGRAPVPIMKVKEASSFLVAVPKWPVHGPWTRLSQLGTPSRAYNLERVTPR